MTNPTTTPSTPADRVARLAQAKAEQQAHAAWVKGGRKGDEPATPTYDALRTDATPTRGRKASTTSTPKEPRVQVQFYKGGKPMPASQNKLSSVAFQATRGIDKKGAPRISSGDLVALLAKAGVANPTSTSWAVELPNGVLIAARIEGDTTPVPQPAPVEKAAKATQAKATPAKKVAAKKETPAKAPAKKAPAKKATTPRKAPAKKA